MKRFRLVLVAALMAVGLAVTAPTANAQVAVGIGFGPAVVGAPVLWGPPVCSWGYFPYYPYACAPAGFYGPSWFVGGVFIGAGPWWGWGRPGWGWGRPGWGGWGRPGWGGGFRPGFGGTRPGFVGGGRPGIGGGVPMPRYGGGVGGARPAYGGGARVGSGFAGGARVGGGFGGGAHFGGGGFGGGHGGGGHR
jgi:hypothetical protein